MTGLLYLCFFCSGLSGLIYQVVWVRMFGNVFGNTVYSASVVVAVFMLGLGAGSYIAGAWADRRYAVQPDRLPRVFGMFELAIGALGLGVATSLPHLGQLSALASAYAVDANGWFVLSCASAAARVAFAVVLLTPITLLMGGTLTLLIRYLVRADLAVGSRRIAALYGVNTAGAAAGAFLTDFALVPAFGLRGTQVVALVFNLAAGLGAMFLAKGPADVQLKPGVRVKRDFRLEPDVRLKPEATGTSRDWRDPIKVSLALALAGFAAMGFEILWFRHFTVLLGGFRAVFSLLLTTILGSMALGSIVGGLLLRRTSRAAESLIVMQALFVLSALAGLAAADAGTIRHTIAAAAAEPQGSAGSARMFEQLWFNGAPILLGTGLPALIMGLAFPLANAVIQRTEGAVGRRAGMLYLANTAGAVCGSLATGFLLLPTVGIQGSATILAIAATLTIFPLSMALPRVTPTVAGSVLAAVAGVALWLLLPANHVITRTLAFPSEHTRVLAVSEDITEVIAVAEAPGAGRTLFTNGHPMSSTEPLAQRYMRALAHIPLLSVERPARVLVIGFGVGNTAHAATLHPSIQRVDIVDLSRHVLNHAGYFADTNGNVLMHPNVVVHVNDGRQHLLMEPGGVYDLITLEPPPIVHAGVGALYSLEFYRLARARLKPGGVLSQWLPVYQVPPATALAMVRAFIDVFPQSVLLSGAQSNLLLLGTTSPRIEIDPARLAGALASIPAVQSDLHRIDLGTAREIVGTFVGSAQTLANATREVAAVTDDRPIQEYGASSLLSFGEEAPTSLLDLSQVAAWCPACFVDGQPVPAVAGLDTYLALLQHAYSATGEEISRTRTLAGNHTRMLAGSAYLGATVPESADVHGMLGAALRDAGQLEASVEEFEQALRLAPGSARIYNDLGIALAMQGRLEDAIERFQRAVEADPAFKDAHQNLATAQKQQAAGSRQQAGSSGRN